MTDELTPELAAFSAPVLARAREDLAAFATLVSSDFQLPPHIEFIVNILEQIEKGELRRVALSAPPQHGKSWTASVLFSAWFLGRHPKAQVILGAHTQDWSDVLSKRVRGLLMNERFGAVFPECRLADDSAAVERFDTTKGGSFSSVGRGTVVGRGGDLVILDDPIRGAVEASSPAILRTLKEWFSQDIYTRLRPGGRILIVSTRWALDDLAGWLLREHADDGWKEIRLPALAEPGDILGRAEGQALAPWYPVEVLERIRAQQGPSAWLSLYQCRPAPVGGAIFKEEWFGTYTEEPKLERTVTAWDTAMGKSEREGDYSAGVTIGQTATHFFVRDVVRGRWPFPELKRRIIEHAERFNPAAILIEDTGSGTSILQELRAGTSLPFLAVRPEGSKLLRAQLVSPTCEASKVLLPVSAPWKTAFLEELLACGGGGAHDDQVDAFVHAMQHLRASSSGPWLSWTGGHGYREDLGRSY